MRGGPRSHEPGLGSKLRSFVSNPKRSLFRSYICSLYFRYFESFFVLYLSKFVRAEVPTPSSVQ
jgi:hypothetical protein